MNSVFCFAHRSTIVGSNRKLTIVALLALALAWGPTSDAEPRLETISAQEFLERIGKNLPEFDRLDAEVLAAQAQVAQAEALPDLKLSYEREEVFAQNEGVVQKSALSVGWSLDVSGRRGLRVRSAKLASAATEKEAARHKNLVVLDAMEVYYLAAQLKLRLASLHRTRAPLLALVEQLKRRVSEGDASGIDLVRFEIELSERDDRLAEAAIEYAVAQGRLAALLGLSSSSIEPSDELAVPKTPNSSQESFALGRSDLLATRDHVASGKALTHAANRWWVPTLELSVGYMNTDIGSVTRPDLAHGYAAMVTASVPVFSRGQAEKKLGTAKIRHAKAVQKILERNIAIEVETAEQSLRSRIEQVRQYSSRQLVQVAELVEKTESAYLGGEAKALELRDAYRQAAEGELRYIDLRFRSHMAQLKLWRATGTIK